MISRRIVINIGVFLGLTGLLIAYAAFRLFGNPLASEQKAYVLFDDASGLRKDFSVSMNGVIVGTVRKLGLEDGGKVRVTIGLDPGAVVPSDVEARVIRASAVGEQRIDLEPTKGGTAPPLASGAVIPTAPDATPPDVSQLVDVASRLLKAIPPDDLNVVLHELATGLRGRSQDLRTIIESNDLFARAFVRHEQGFRQLLASSRPVLDTLADDGPVLRQAIANTVVLSQLLADRRFDLVALLRNGARLGEVGTDIVGGELPNLACLVSDLADVNRVVAKPKELADLDTILRTNQGFFGPIDRLAPEGPTKAIPELGLAARPDQVWLRVRTILPPAQPAALAYNPKRPTPPTKPGAACVNQFGRGVGPATQADASRPAKGGKVLPPTTAEAQVTPGPDSPLALRAAAHSRPAGAGATDLVLVALGALAVAGLGGWRPPRRVLYWRPWR